MNSQQELLDAINTISQKKERSFDTPATVLRVEGDTVWVHIDGGADETPCQKTINCEEGETVQVRISNGSAFLVGNASAPPTDDKTANVAHFVAEQADEKATDAEEKAVEAIRSVEAISQTVEGKVDSGDSNITDISSTMYQDAYGVNIFNDTLAVGDYYVHIDGDSYDIKQATRAGQIDNENDKTIASFGEFSFISHIETDPVFGDSRYNFNFSSNGLSLFAQTAGTNTSMHAMLGLAGVGFASGSAGWETYFGYNRIFDGRDTEGMWPRISNQLDYDDGKLYVADKIRVGDDLIVEGDIKNANGRRLVPFMLESDTISASETSYTFYSPDILEDSMVDIYDTIFGFSPTNCVVIYHYCTITFPAQSSSHKIRLFVY